MRQPGSRRGTHLKTLFTNWRCRRKRISPRFAPTRPSPAIGDGSRIRAPDGSAALSSTADRSSQTSSIKHVEFADAKNVARACQRKKKRDFSPAGVSRLVLLEFLG